MGNQDKISIVEWWSYTRETVHRAWRGIGKTDVFRSIVGAILTGWFSWYKGWSNFHNVITVIIPTSFGLVGVFLIQLVIKLLVTPAKMAKEQTAKFEEEQRRHLETKKILESEKNAKAEKVVKELTELGKALLRRISSIKGIDPIKYNPDKDDETWAVIHEAIAYIVLNLTPEAGQVFDDGIMNIHGFAIPHSGLGSTMYEDRHREILAKLDRRFKSLKRIIDEIDKYLKPVRSVSQK